VTYAGVVVIHQHVLKSTTSAGAVRDSRLVDLVSLVALVYLVSLIQPNERDKPNKPDEPSIAFGSGSEVFLSPRDWRGHDYAGCSDGIPTPDDA